MSMQDYLHSEINPYSIEEFRQQVLSEHLIDLPKPQLRNEIEDIYLLAG